MPAPLRIELTPEQERTLEDLKVASHIPQRTRETEGIMSRNARRQIQTGF
jgi:hypothetical protein